MATMPAHVRAYLADIGRLDTDGYTRRARLRTCHLCGGPVLVGLDDEPAGIPTTTDPTHLDALAETIALTTGRHTYDLIPGPSLQHRDPFRIDTHRPYPVVPDHRCRGGVPLRIDPTITRILHPLTHLEPIPDKPPF